MIVQQNGFEIRHIYSAIVGRVTMDYVTAGYVTMDSVIYRSVPCVCSSVCV